jgi:hypothetical protein
VGRLLQARQEHAQGGFSMEGRGRGKGSPAQLLPSVVSGGARLKRRTTADPNRHHPSSKADEGATREPSQGCAPHARGPRRNHDRVRKASVRGVRAIPLPFVRGHPRQRTARADAIAE